MIKEIIEFKHDFGVDDLPIPLWDEIINDFESE